MPPRGPKNGVHFSFAHVCETGGSRRSWLTGIDNVRKKYTIAAAAHNLGPILRQLIGSGKPRGFAALAGLLCAAQVVIQSLLKLRTCLGHPHPEIITSPAIATRWDEIRQSLRKHGFFNGLRGAFLSRRDCSS